MTASTALLFPGQGSHTADMGELARRLCPALVEQAEMLVGCDPFERVGESTRFAQPAMFVASIARFEALGRPAADVFAGHSLGEVTALAAAGAVDVEDALWLVVMRGAAMAEAGDPDFDGMLALLKATPEQAALLADAHRVVVANDNAPGQLVLSGPAQALRAVAAEAHLLGLRAIRLDVAGAFHSPAMEGPARTFEAALARVEFREPTAPVYSGMTAAPYRDVRAELARALVAPVRWRETVLALEAAGIECLIDVGPGSTLARMARRTVTDADVRSGEELLDAVA